MCWMLAAYSGHPNMTMSMYKQKYILTVSYPRTGYWQSYKHAHGCWLSIYVYQVDLDWTKCNGQDGLQVYEKTVMHVCKYAHTNIHQSTTKLMYSIRIFLKWNIEVDCKASCSCPLLVISVNWFFFFNETALSAIPEILDWCSPSDSPSGHFYIKAILRHDVI